MADVRKAGTCLIGSATGSVAVALRIEGGHVGVFSVVRSGSPLPHSPNGTVPLGNATTLLGTTITVSTTLTKVAAGSQFNVKVQLRGLRCSVEAPGSFAAGATTAVVDVTVAFNA
jgi:hypothetical protein